RASHAPGTYPPRYARTQVAVPRLPWRGHGPRDRRTQLDGGLSGISATQAKGGNVYDKYGSRNPIERRLVNDFLTELERLADATGALAAHEIGCGEGELSIRLARRGLRMRGTDVSPGAIAEARRRAAPGSVDSERVAA